MTEHKVSGKAEVDTDYIIKSAASSFTGGVNSIPEIVMYWDDGFYGNEWRTNLSYLYVGDDWNDEISSVVVISGTWDVFIDRDYMGQHARIGPGYYPNMASIGLPNDTISSFKIVSY